MGHLIFHIPHYPTWAPSIVQSAPHCNTNSSFACFLQVRLPTSELQLEPKTAEKRGEATLFNCWFFYENCHLYRYDYDKIRDAISRTSSISPNLSSDETVPKISVPSTRTRGVERFLLTRDSDASVFNLFQSFRQKYKIINGMKNRKTCSQNAADSTLCLYQC